MGKYNGATHPHQFKRVVPTKSLWIDDVVSHILTLIRLVVQNQKNKINK